MTTCTFIAKGRIRLISSDSEPVTDWQDSLFEVSMDDDEHMISFTPLYYLTFSFPHRSPPLAGMEYSVICLGQYRDQETKTFREFRPKPDCYQGYLCVNLIPLDWTFAVLEAYVRAG